jgi:hypothetical protein
MRITVYLLGVTLALFPALHAHGHPSLVLFDEGHGQAFTIAGEEALDLSRLAAVMKERGARVSTVRGKIDNASLEGAKGLVVSGPFRPFEESEIRAVKDFLEAGGRLAVMLHIGPPVTTLLQRLGVAHSLGVINEGDQFVGDSALDFTVTRMEPHALTRGLDSFAVYGGWALKSVTRDAFVVAHTGPRAWLDLNRNRTYDAGEPVGSLGVVITGNTGEGSFLVFGDDAIFQNRFLEEGNLVLARNLADWLLQQ